MSVPAGAMPVLTRMVAPLLGSSALRGVRVGFSSDDEAVSVLASVLTQAGAGVVPPGDADVVVETGRGRFGISPTALVSTTKRTADTSAAAGVPVVACHLASCVRLADRSMGRRIVQETLRLTNRRMPGTRAAVTGYGATAGSIAATVTALGGTVTVIAPDPLEALTALLDGHTPGTSNADMVFACDGERFDAAALEVGAVLVDVDASAEPIGGEVRPGVWKHGRGYLVRPRVRRSFEDSDLVLSVAALALDHLVTERPGPGVIEAPARIDTAVAALAVEVLS